MTTSTLTFSGKGPFYLRKVEHARASALDNTIQLTLFAQVEGQDQELAQIQIETQMALHVAELLADTLDHAINDAARDAVSQAVQARATDLRATASALYRLRQVHWLTTVPSISNAPPNWYSTFAGGVFRKGGG